jgi:hypothetical protein
MSPVTSPSSAWQVGCTLTFEVEEAAAIALQVAVAAAPGREVRDRLDLTIDGRPLPEPVREVPSTHGGRLHLANVPAGLLRATYEASARGGRPQGDGDEGEDGDGDEVEDGDEGEAAANGAAGALERLVALRPSRYCPSDVLAGFANGEIADREPGAALARSVAAWVSRRTAYVLGSSGPHDTAVETLLTGQGVCRDFAHLTVGLLRAVGIPARLVSAYAPGLTPMDFHAVAEAHVDGAWHIFDPTGLAPRQSLVRIATGRDAADTAFADVLSGSAMLTGIEVLAIVEGLLPLDDGTDLVCLP